jgi:hypothetical protein
MLRRLIVAIKLLHAESELPYKTPRRLYKRFAKPRSVLTAVKA